MQHKELTNEERPDGFGGPEDEDRQEEEEVTEELKRFMVQKMAKGFFLCLSGHYQFLTQELNAEWYMKVAVADQKAIQCYHVIHDEEKSSYYSYTILDFFFSRG